MNHIRGLKQQRRSRLASTGLIMIANVLILLLVACKPLEDDHTHEGETHSHHDILDTGHHDHEHHDESIQQLTFTHYTEQTELFVEFPVLIADFESEFIAHLTELDGFKPLSKGVLTVTLSGGGEVDEVFSIERARTAGIFKSIVIPEKAVQRHLSIRYREGDLDVVHDLGQIEVYASPMLARAGGMGEGSTDDEIVYLKEQQWQVDFELTQAQQNTLRSSVNATGVIRPRSDSEVYVHAPSIGHLQTKNRFPYPGMRVEQGQWLATIRPRLGGGGDIATLQAAKDKAHSEYLLARHERERLEKLWRQRAIAKHRLHEAESSEIVAKAEYDAALRRFQQSQGGQQDSAGIPLLAPISGVLTQVNGASGKYVQEGEMLFHIVNLDQLWLETRIAEVDLGRLLNPQHAWFSIEGFEERFSTETLSGHKVSMAQVVDDVTRTVPLIFEFRNPRGRLQSGMFAKARVYTGEVEEGVVVPVSAIFDDGGQDVVYIMRAGESFQRRVVQIGMQDGDKVIVRLGVEAGEYVVSRGAYQLRLASASPAEAGHGHAH